MKEEMDEYEAGNLVFVLKYERADRQMQQLQRVSISVREATHATGPRCAATHSQGTRVRTSQSHLCSLDRLTCRRAVSELVSELLGDYGMCLKGSFELV